MRGHHLNMKQARLWVLLRNISNSTSSTMDLFGTITPKQNVPSILCILGRGCIPPIQGRLCLCGSLETPSAHRSEALHISYQHGDGVATFFFFPHMSIHCSVPIDIQTSLVPADAIPCQQISPRETALINALGFQTSALIKARGGTGLNSSGTVQENKL